jgi:undecaprenyl-diphosphatase
MTALQAMFLGLVQGVAEFLPISSSGHLSIFQNFFGMTTPEEGALFFDVLLHLGTLVSGCLVYWRDIRSLVGDCAGFVRSIGHPVPGGNKRRYPGARLLLMMFLATLPLFLILPINDHIARLYSSTAFIGVALLLTGAMLYVAYRMPRGTRTEKNMSGWDALLVGVCQAVATLPGLSRSGTTITAGISAGLDRQFAVKFSFLISIPAVLGANLLSLIDALKTGVDFSQLPVWLLGMLVAMIAGYFSIRLVKYISQKGKFGWFAVYCAAVGLLTLILTVVL